MMRRPLPTGSGLLSCQICGLINRQQTSAAVHSAKRSFVTLDAGRRLARLPQARSTPSIQSRFFSTSPLCLKVKRSPAVQSHNGSPRFAKSPASGAAVSPEKDQHHHEEQRQQQQLQPSDFADLAAAVDRVTETFVAQQGIPSEHMTLTALQACRHTVGKLQAVVKLPLDVSPLPVTASQGLLGLDTDNRKGGDSSDVKTAIQRQYSDLVDKISEAGYTIISHPPVVITPQILQKYVALQASLGRPESLPHVFELFASKPTPKLVSGSIHYTSRSPNRAKNAIEVEVSEAALDAAIASKNMDAAIGIVESTYGAKAYKYHRSLTKALLPVTLATSAPVAIYMVAKKLAQIQDTWDPAIFTKVAFSAIMSYYVFTGIIGLTAMATANDQMKRVTWGEGIPLWERWLREDERAAYDKIACSFGFSNDLRAGEEDGPEFALLREFILHKGMILDKVDLMPGMN